MVAWRGLFSPPPSASAQLPHTSADRCMASIASEFMSQAGATAVYGSPANEMCDTHPEIITEFVKGKRRAGSDQAIVLAVRYRLELEAKLLERSKIMYVSRGFLASRTATHLAARASPGARRTGSSRTGLLCCSASASSQPPS